MDGKALMMLAAGISAENRRLLERLHRHARGPVSIGEAAEILGIPVPRARRLLRYLAGRGWLSRVRRGLYLPVPLDAHRSGQARGDPWIIANTLFAPCYIGGWSAAEHWDLTEQIFHDVLVATRRRPRERNITVQDTSFSVHTVGDEKFFGLARVWRDSHRIEVSDPTRTIVDVLNHPAWGGGMRHVMGMIDEYFNGEHSSEQQLVEYGDKLGNMTVFKRLGLVAEALKLGSDDLIAACLERGTKGVGALDPSVDAVGPISTRWGLRINVTLPES